MSAKIRPPIVRSVKTPESLAALRGWLGAFGERTRERGTACFAARQVARVWADADHFVEAIVRGEETCSVTLFLTRGQWSSQCTCAVRVNCLHAYAAGLAWLEDAASLPVDPPAC